MGTVKIGILPKSDFTDVTQEFPVFTRRKYLVFVLKWTVVSSTTNPVLFCPQSSDRMDRPCQSSTGEAGQKPLTCVDLSL